MPLNNQQTNCLCFDVSKAFEHGEMGDRLGTFREIWRHFWCDNILSQIRWFVTDDVPHASFETYFPICKGVISSENFPMKCGSLSRKPVGNSFREFGGLQILEVQKPRKHFKDFIFGFGFWVNQTNQSAIIQLMVMRCRIFEKHSFRCDFSREDFLKQSAVSAADSGNM